MKRSTLAFKKKKKKKKNDFKLSDVSGAIGSEYFTGALKIYKGLRH